MASTRYTQQPLQIYQDPVTSFDHSTMQPMPNSSRPGLAGSSNSNPSSRSKKLSPLRPIKNAASRRNIVLNPPQPNPSNLSPSKSAQQSSSSPSRAPFGNRLNMISMPPPGRATNQTDSIEKKQPLMSKFKPHKALFTTFSSQSLDTENIPPNGQQTTFTRTFDGSNFSLDGLYDQKRSTKRTLLEAAPIPDSRPLKKSKTEGQQAEEAQDELILPAPDSFPPLHDDGSKPPHSYAQLIGMSILRAPARRLTLAQIYKWISDTYSFYSPSDAGWQNSIRHNLSLNKAFIKQERPKDDPGKGNYWAIQPGSEQQFIKDKSARKPGPNENVPLLSTNLAPLTHADIKPLAPAPPELLSQSQTSLQSGQLSTVPELSSDATIPASDVFEDGGEEEPQQLPPSSPLLQSSPPGVVMHSSPPVARHVSRRQATPPPVPRFPSSSQTRSHKRKFASMDDSGYFSSLDSSAKRPHQLLTSGANRPRVKRGRAEEEIARLRGSSYDSPSKNRASVSGYGPPSSSPLRRAQMLSSAQMLPPLTPAVHLKPPTKPPPSISPNTNLRLHRDKVRELVGSPVRGLTCLEESLPPWSPNFNFDEVPFVFSNLADEPDVFADSGLDFDWGSIENGSPEKRSAKRPRLDRARSAHVLADVPNCNKSVTSTPLLKFTPSLGPSVFNSPTRGFGLMSSPSKLFDMDSPSKMKSPAINTGSFSLPQDEEFYGAEFLSEEVTGFSGMDITQGFQKIGARAQPARSAPQGNNPRATLSRSFTSQF